MYKIWGADQLGVKNERQTKKNKIRAEFEAMPNVITKKGIKKINYERMDIGKEPKIFL